MPKLRKPASQNILDYFDGTPRIQQKYILEQVQEHWKNADVFVIEAAVACGKSKVATCIAKWNNKVNKEKSRIITPTNMLVQQYTDTNPGLHCLMKQGLYRCHCYPEGMVDDTVVDMSCKGYKERNGEFCPNCIYLQAVRKSYVMPYMVCNYHVYMVQKLFANTVIIDEFHNTIPFIKSLAGDRLWWHDYKYPKWVDSYGSLLKWIDIKLNEEDFREDKKLIDLKNKVEAGKMTHLIERGTDLYRGEERDCLKMLPMDIKHERPWLWPKKVEKIVLMSATINEVDIEAVGLGNRRVVYIKASSAIDKERRPLVYQPVVNMALKYQPKSMPKLVDYILELVAFHDEQGEVGKGMVHATYAVAELLKQRVGDNSRFLFHDKENKNQVYEEWRSSDVSERKILIGAGMAEGLDLAGNDYLWQIVCKVPFPSLEHPAIRYQAENRNREYVWDTLRVMCQTYGRICRTPTDYGVTYVVDSQFERLCKKGDDYGLLPDWFKEVLSEEFFTDKAEEIQL